MISVGVAKLEDLTNEELRWIVQYCQRCFDPVSHEDLVRRVRTGSATIYRFDGDCSGIFILAVGDGGLYVETVAGEGIVKNFDKLYEKISDVARLCGAEKLYTFSGRPALDRLFSRRFKKVASLYKEDLL